MKGATEPSWNNICDLSIAKQLMIGDDLDQSILFEVFREFNE